MQQASRQMPQQYPQPPVLNSIFTGVSSEMQIPSTLQNMPQSNMSQQPIMNQCFNPYAGTQMMGYPYNPQPYQPMYYPGGYPLVGNAPYYQPNSYPQPNWGAPMCGPNYAMNQPPYQPQFQPQFGFQYQFQFQQQFQQPQFQSSFPTQTQYQSLVDMTKKGLFFMNQATENNYNKTINAASESGQNKVTDNAKINDAMSNKGDIYLDDFP
jgi:hypothetical protein